MTTMHSASKSEAGVAKPWQHQQPRFAEYVVDIGRDPLSEYRLVFYCRKVTLVSPI